MKKETTKKPKETKKIALYGAHVKGSMRNMPETVNEFRMILKEIGENFSTFLGLADDIHKVCAVPMPIKFRYTLKEELVKEYMTDEGFVREVKKAIADEDILTRMSMLVKLGGMLNQSKASFQSKLDKLNERIKLSGPDSAEFHVAIVKKGDVETALRSISSKIEFVAGKFFELRERIAKTLFNLTSGLYDVAGSDVGVVKAMKSDDYQEILREARDLDAKFRKEHKNV